MLRLVRKWLCVKGKGSNKTRSDQIEVRVTRYIPLRLLVKKKFDATISIPFTEGDRNQLMDLTVVAECAESVARVFAFLGRSR